MLSRREGCYHVLLTPIDANLLISDKAVIHPNDQASLIYFNRRVDKEGNLSGMENSVLYNWSGQVDNVKRSRW